MSKKLKQQDSTNASNVLYTLLCGVDSDKIEGFVFWLGVMCENKGIIQNGDKFELMWYVNDEAKNLWEGVNSKELPLYTTKQIMKRYLDTHTHNVSHIPERGD